MIDWLPEDLAPSFPHTSSALTDENANGLLAAGGRLTPEWLVSAYRQGIFPWYDDESPILWWSPAPRMCLAKEDFRLGRTLKKALKKSSFSITTNTDFQGVIHKCSEPRDDHEGTWITEEMMEAYCDLHSNGLAISAECWNDDGELVGGLYGVAIGNIFFGESMFSHRDSASKITFANLCPFLFDAGIKLIDCQMHTDHLAQFGAKEVSRSDFERLLRKHANTHTGISNISLPTMIKQP